MRLLSYWSQLWFSLNTSFTSLPTPPPQMPPLLKCTLQGPKSNPRGHAIPWHDTYMPLPLTHNQPTDATPFPLMHYPHPIMARAANGLAFVGKYRVLLLHCIWKRCIVVLEQTVVQDRWDQGVSSPHLSAPSHCWSVTPPWMSPRTDVSHPSDLSPPPLICHPHSWVVIPWTSSPPWMSPPAVLGLCSGWVLCCWRLLRFTENCGKQWKCICALISPFILAFNFSEFWSVIAW